MRPFAAAVTALCITGCATLALHEFDQRYGKPDPTRYDVAAKPEAGMSYRKDIQPIVERRCVVCHACYDGPCQLKLTAWGGIARGTSKAPVYDAARLSEAPTTRLFLDAQLPSQWWERGFSPVLNNRTATPETNLAASVLYRSLQLKLHECARELAAIPDLPFERAEAFGRRIALALPAIEMLDRALDFLWR